MPKKAKRAPRAALNPTLPIISTTSLPVGTTLTLNTTAALSGKKVVVAGMLVIGELAASVRSTARER